MQNEVSIYEQIQKDKKSYKGITLSYSGAQYTPSSFQDNSYIHDDPSLTPLQAFTERFRNIGALVIRFHLGQGQRAGLLQQISKFNYSDNPVERPALGNDAEDLFFKDETLDQAMIIGSVLEFASHQPLGRSKVLDEQAHPLIHINKKNVYGEQGLWDIIHAPVWNVGRSLKYELSKQGLVYLSCPPKLGNEDRAIMDKQLRESGKPYQVVLDELFVPSVMFEIGKLSIYMDDKGEFTQQENGLAISGSKEDKTYSPLGWIIHKETGEVLPQEVTEDILRISAIAEGGFYEKRPTQQKLLQSGNLINTSGLGLFIQNQAFNAIYVVLDYLQKYNFDPRPLLDSSLQIAARRLKTTIDADPSVIDDFLVGAIQDEMVQALRVSQQNSVRKALPVRFTNSFAVTYNNLKAIAYAFDIRDAGGQPVFRAYDDTPVVAHEDSFIDSAVNGQLATPSFNTGSHVAAIISTAELVAEQMILEQLLPAIFMKKEDFLNNTLFKILVDIFGEEEAELFLSVMLEEVTMMPVDNGKPVTGLQFDYCQQLIQTLRTKLGTNKLPSLLCKFSKPGVSTAEIMENLDSREQKQLDHILKVLFIISKRLQESPLTSSQSELSRGINAGLSPLIAHLNPDLAAKMNINPKSIIKADIPAVDKSLVRDRVSTEAFKRCPFLASQAQSLTDKLTKEAEIKQEQYQEQPSILKQIWAQRSTIAIIGTTLGAAVMASIVMNQ